MRTAEEINFEEGKRKLPDGIYPGMAYDKQINAMKAYAKEAIKADRLNLVQHATISDVGGLGSNGEYMEHFIVDKNSIINAPKIKLL